MALPLMTLRQLLLQFKTMVRFIMETCSDEVDSQLFRTSMVNGTRLRALAIQHTLPSVNCIPIWNNHIAFIITQAIIRQKGRLSKQAARDHEQGTLVLPWSNLSVKGVPTFRSITSRGPVTTLSVHIPNSTDSANVLIDNHLHVLDDTSMFFLAPNVVCFVTFKSAACSFDLDGGTSFAPHVKLRQGPRHGSAFATIHGTGVTCMQLASDRVKPRCMKHLTEQCLLFMSTSFV